MCRFNRPSNKPSYYITAYGLAVKRGFKGTLDEWLASLKAHEIELRYQNEKLQWRRISDTDAAEEEVEYEPDDPRAWQDLMDIAEIRGAVVESTLHEAQDYAREAKESAERLAGRVEDIDQLLQDVQDIWDELNYKPIDITKFTNSAAGTHEIGSVIDTVTLTWELNKDPESQTLNGTALDAEARTKEFNSVSTGQTYTLKATDERGATDTASSSVNFYNGVYYGVLADGAQIDSAAILSLSRKLQSGRAVTFTATAGAGQRHAYAIPSRFGTPTFKDAETGFQAGFYLATEEPVLFTNASGYTEEYNVWLSTHPALGSMTVAVS